MSLRSMMMALMAGSTEEVPVTFGDLIAACFGIYSFRLLNPNYTGPCIRLRRASDNAEADIAFANGFMNVAGAVSWLNGSAGYVRKWYHQGARASVEQANPGWQPLLALDASNRPLVRFSGGQMLELTGLSDWPDFAKISLNTVAKATATGCIAGTGLYAGRIIRANWALNGVFNAVTGGAGGVFPTNAPHTVLSSLTTTYRNLGEDIGEVAAYVNGYTGAFSGSAPVSTTNPSPLSLGAFSNGGNPVEGMSGDVYEVLHSPQLITEEQANTLIAPNQDSFYNLY